MATNLNTQKNKKVYKYVEAMLGGGMIDAPARSCIMKLALDTALNKFRQRSVITQ